MIQVTLNIPTEADLRTLNPDEIQQNVISKEKQYELANNGVSIFVADNEIVVSPGGVVTIPIYVVLGDPSQLIQASKQYYPSLNNQPQPPPPDVNLYYRPYEE